MRLDALFGTDAPDANRALPTNQYASYRFILDAGCLLVFNGYVTYRNCAAIQIGRFEQHPGG